MNLLNIDMRKTMSVTVAILLTLSVLAAAVPMMTAGAVSVGTVTLSDDTIFGDKVVQITVTDSDIAGNDAAPPRVTCNLDMEDADGNVLTQVMLYQISGGSWVGFVALIGADTGSIPAKAPAQDPVEPGGVGAGTWDNDGLPLTPGREPLMSDADWVNPAIITFVEEDGTATFTYDDSAPVAAISIDLDIDDNAGELEIDRTSYPVGAVIYVDITDADLNLDPTAADILANTEFGAADFASGFGDAEESGPNTGIFSNSDATIDPGTRGKILKVQYFDADPEDTISVTASITSFDSMIALGASEYKISDTAIITITDPDLNLDSDSDDSYYDIDLAKIESDTTEDLALELAVEIVETGGNTGIFEGEFYFDMDDSTVSETPTLQVASGDTITATYMDAATKTGVPKSATAKSSFVTFTGEISLDRDTYTQAMVGTVTVNDPDMNTDGGAIETIAADFDENAPGGVDGTAYVYSSSDETETPILLTETGADTAIFTGTFSFTAGSTQTGISPEIEAETGDTITAIYYDAANTGGDDNYYTATATFGSNTGDIDFGKNAYSYKAGTIIDVEVTDPDLNENTVAVEVYDNFVTISYGDPDDSGVEDEDVEITETDANTGIFTGTHEVLAEQDPLETIVATYYDAANSAGNDVEHNAYASFTSNTGSITLDALSYPIGSDVTISVTDPDWNLDPGAKDEIPIPPGAEAGDPDVVDVRSTSDMTGILVALTETDVDTSIFEGDVTVKDASSSQAGGILKVVKGDTIYARYTDQLDAAEAEQSIETTAIVTAATGSISIDKTVYHVNSKVVVTIVDPDRDESDTAIDEIEEDEGLLVVRTTTMGSTEDIGTAEETGVTTGIFEVSFTLNTADFEASDGDGMTITYTDEYEAAGARNVAKSVTAMIVAELATLEWDANTYLVGDTATLTVNDPDANDNPDLLQTKTLTIYSSTDPAGITVSVRETGENTGLFTGTCTFSYSSTAGSMIRVSDGDTITASYTDYTVSGYDPSDPKGVSEKIVVKAKIGAPTPTLPITSGTPELQDANGNPITQGRRGTQVLLATDLTNTATIDQAMLYIVQVKNTAGTVVYLSYISGTVPAGKTFTFGLSWTPTSAGQYTVEVYSWKSWSDPTPLSLVSTGTVTIV